MPTVTINGLGDVEFPESMSVDQIRQASRDLYAKHVAPVPAHGPGVQPTPDNAATPPVTRALMAQAASEPMFGDKNYQAPPPPPEGTIGPDTRSPITKATSAVSSFFTPAPEGQMPQTAGQVLTGIPTAIGRGVKAAEKMTGTEGALNKSVLDYHLLPEMPTGVDYARKAADTLNEADSPLWQAMGHAINSGVDTAESLTTPENLILAAGLGTPPGLIRKMSAVGFGVPLVRHAIVSGQGALTSLVEGDIPGAAGQGVSAIASGVLGGGALAHGLEEAPMETNAVPSVEAGPSRQEGMALKRTASLKQADALAQEVAGEREGTRAQIMAGAAEGLPKITPTPLPGQAEPTKLVPLAPGDVEQLGKPAFDEQTQAQREAAAAAAADAARLADQQSRIKTRGDAIDALNAGEKLHPEVMDKFFGSLPANVGYVDTGNGKGLRASEMTKDGRIIQQLSPADEDTAALATGVVTDHYGTSDPQELANAWAKENGVKGKIVVSEKVAGVPETRTVKGGNWRIVLPQDAPLMDLVHELMLHVQTADGRTVLGDILPHDDTTNQMLADKIVQEGVPAYNGVARPASPDENFSPSPTLPTPGGQSPGIIQKMKDMVGMGQGEAVANAYPATLKTVRKLTGPDVNMDLRATVGGLNRVRAANFFAKRDINDLYGDDTAYDKFRAAKIADNLRGKAAEYMDSSKAADTLPLTKGGRISMASGSPAARMLGILKDEIEGKKLFPQTGIADNIRQMIADGKDGEAKALLKDTFAKAAAAVPKRPDPNVFDVDAWMADPKWLQSNDIYEHYMGSISKEARGVLGKDDRSTHVGDFGHYPLVALGEDGERVRSTSAEKPGAFVTGRQEFYRSGLHDTYDPSEEALIRSMASYLKSANSKQLVDSLERGGWQQPISPGHNPVTTTPDGKRVMEVNGTKFLASDPYAISTRAGGVRQAVMPKAIHDAIEPILDPQYRGSSEEAYNIVGRLLNRIQMTGIGDVTSHSISEAATLTGNIPYLEGKTGTRTVVGNLPGIKLGNVVRTAAKSMTDKFWDDPQNVTEVNEMAQNGELPSRFLSPQSAHGLGNFLWGEHGSDIVGRVIMRRAAKQMNPELAQTVEDSQAILKDPNAPADAKATAKTQLAKSNQILYDWTTKMGNYVPEFQSAIGRWAGRTGLGPFHVAGTTMNRNAIDYWTGMGKMPFESQTSSGAMQARAINQLNGGAAGATALWVATYVAITGKPPWKDPDSKLLEIPVPDAWKDTWLGHVLWPVTDKRGQKNYINMGYFINPGLQRGANILPIGGTYQTWMSGGNATQVLAKDAANYITAKTRPYAGPAIHAGAAALGVSPGIANLINDRGQWRPQFYSTGVKASPNPLTTVGNIVGGMAQGLNPMGQAGFENTFGPKSAGRSDGEKAAAVVAHLFPPTSMIFQSANPELNRKAMEAQKKAMAGKQSAEELARAANSASSH